MTNIKICGLKRPEDIEAANRLKPDLIGFVLAPSKRQISPEQAASLKAMLHPQIQAVGVFVDASIEQILQVVKLAAIDMIQLHGNETPCFLRQLSAVTSLPIIQAVSVTSREDMLQAQALPCDYLLFDTFSPGQRGGSGKSFDWSLIPPLNKPYFLAGGIHMGNIKEACLLQPYAIDVSSGVETEGQKDPNKMKELIEAIRRIHP